MIAIFLTLILIGVAVYLVGLIPMDARILQVIRVVAVLLAILIVANAFGLVNWNLPGRVR
jgi:hypothetical protein